MTLDMYEALAPETVPHRRSFNERNPARLIAIEAKRRHVCIIIHVNPSLRPVMPDMVRSGLRNAFAVFRRRSRAVKVSCDATHRAPVDRDTQSCFVGNVLAGDERVETDAAGGWLRSVTVIIGPLVMREWNSQPFPYFLLLWRQL